MEKDIVIVGAGHAGISCAEALRIKGFKGTLTIVDRQIGFPTEKPPLSKGAIVNGTNEDYSVPLLKPENWYVDNNIDLKTGITATSIDRINRKINLSNKNTISYTTLVIATGAIPIELGITRKHPQSFTLRNSKDAKEISRAASTFKSALIIGCGYIGLEVAASLTERGLKVTVVETEHRPLAKISSSAIAEKLVQIHERKGVKFRFSNSVVNVDHLNNGFRALLRTGGHEIAEMIITGVGVSPDSILASESSLAKNDNDKNSICVNENFVTSDHHILAIGDVAKRVGAEKRIESVDNAQEDGKQAAAYIMKEVKQPRGVPWFWSDQYDKTLQIAGLVPTNDANVRMVFRPGKRGDGFSVWGFVDEKLRSVEAFSDPSSFAIGKRFLSDDLFPPSSEIMDTSNDLKFIYKRFHAKAKEINQA